MTNFDFNNDLPLVVSSSIYDFSSPAQYHEGRFGVNRGADSAGKTPQSQVAVYSITLNAAQLAEDFVIFEQIPNVENWPISKLIQRELNAERAQRICDDYLLKNNGLKYFPALTAVMIPTDDLHQPRESYEEADAKEGEALKIKYSNLPWDKVQIDSKVRGLSLVRSSSSSLSGVLAWDKRKLSAVIIDGQHRFKALLLARHKDKAYDECAVSVNVIDLTQLSLSVSQSPTAMARDLFVTINSTPAEVDEARLVLMDDKESLATFTQVLVDDSDKQIGPAVRPELIDWRCEQGKHDSGVSLTGVLTLWSILNFAMCRGRAMASIEDRLNESIVRKWCDSMNSWLDADKCLETALGPVETLQSRLEQATSSSNAGDTEEESPFLFSYSKGAVDVLRGEFRRRYAPAFQQVFSNLAPYSSFQTIAQTNKAFDSKSKLHSYLRSFRARRAELYAEDAATHSAVDKYKQQLSELTSGRILYTVMGQKAVFYTLFNRYLHELEDLSDVNSIAAASKEFIKCFNERHDVLQGSNSLTEDFFNTKFRPEYKRGAIPKSGNSCYDFWKGIIVKVNDELDYGNPATKTLATVFYDILTYESGESFEFSSRNEILKRHRRILELSGLGEDDAIDVAELAVKAKENVVQKLLS